MTEEDATGYVQLKRPLYGVYSGSSDQYRREFVGAEALAARVDRALEPLQSGQWLLDLGCGSSTLLSSAVARLGGNGVAVGMYLTPKICPWSETASEPWPAWLKGTSWQICSYRTAVSIWLLA